MLLLIRIKVRINLDLKKLIGRRMHVIQTNFNINISYDEDCLRLFKFRAHELGTLSAVLDFGGKTVRRRYCFSRVKESCVFLRLLSSPCRWYDLELLFCMTTQVLSEVFWHVLNDCKDIYDKLVGMLRTYITNRLASFYADFVQSNGAPLPNFLGFIDGTKIFMARPGGKNVNQKVCYSGQKRAHCPVYLTFSTPDGFILYLHGPEVGRRQYMSLYRQIFLDDELQNSLVIDFIQYYLYGDPSFVLRPRLQVVFNRAFATLQEFKLISVKRLNGATKILSSSLPYWIINECLK